MPGSKIPAGTTQLWRLLNAATDAFLDLTLVDESGKALPLDIFARDGAPLTDDAGRRLHPPPTTAPQLVPPAGRLEFLVAPPPPGVKAYLLTRAVLTGCAGDQLPERRLAVVTALPAASVPPPKAAAAPAEPVVAPNVFSGLMSRKIDHERIIALAEYPRPGTSDATDFYIMERRPNAVLKPFKMDDPPMITVSAGTTEEWTVENWTNELHAFHIHQLHFRVLAIDGKRLEDPPLLDTVTVPFATATGYRDRQEGPVRPGRVVIKLYFPPALAGDIPVHCHLVDHEDNGMMGVVRVLPSAATPIQKTDRSLDDLILRFDLPCRRTTTGGSREHFLGRVPGVQHVRFRQSWMDQEHQAVLLSSRATGRRSTGRIESKVEVDLAATAHKAWNTLSETASTIRFRVHLPGGIAGLTKA